MIIFVENKKSENRKQEGTWSLPAMGREVSNAKAAIAELDGLKKKLYSVFGDDSLFDDLDGAISRIKELAVNAYAINCTKYNFPPGSKPTRLEVTTFAVSLLQNAGKQLKVIGVTGINQNDFIDTCLRSAGFRS